MTPAFRCLAFSDYREVKPRSFLQQTRLFKRIHNKYRLIVPDGDSIRHNKRRQEVSMK
jgi:DNA replication protein DnaC